MKPFYRNLKFIVAVVLAFLGANTSVVFAQTSITAIGSPITQNFDSLYTDFNPSLTWTNRTTPPRNWYALGNGSVPSSYILNDGNNVTLNSLSSFGSITTPSDRALGFVPGGVNNTISYYGWRLKNNTASTINSISITWTLEQWRVTSSASQSLVIYHQTSTNAITSIVPTSLNSQGLSQASPKTLGSGTALDGNASGNFVTTTQNLTGLNIAPGSEILICWGHTRAAFGGQNHLLAIDDVTVVAKANQTIDFTPTGDKTFGDANFNLSATASSGLTVSFASSNTNIATVSGTTVTLRGPGTVTFTASQGGNSNYNSAESQYQTINVIPATPVTKAATSITQNSFTANWTANNGLTDASTTYGIDYTTDVDFFSWSSVGSAVKTLNITGLTPNSIYYYRLFSFTDGLNSNESTSSAITTGTDYVTINSGSWDVGGNWDVGYINDIANSITISRNHAITLNTARASVTTNKLVIGYGAKLTTNQIINVLNELVIEVDANGIAGQILNTNNIVVGSNAKVTVRKTFANGEWAFMGFPFTVNAADIHIANTETQLTWGDLNGSGDFVVQEYNGATRASSATANYTGAGLHWNNVASRVFTAKKGYIVYNNNVANVIDFTSTGNNIGSFFSQSSSVPATAYNSTNEHSNWNLIATPLSSKYNLGYTNPANTYYAYNGTNYLPALSGETLDVQPFSAFFVQASSSINFASGGRKVMAATRVEEKPVDDIKLVLSNGNSKYDDITRIRLQEGANPNYEIGTDAMKMLGMNPNVSYLYSSIKNMGIAINTLPTTVTEVELNTKFAAAGNYSISLTDVENIQRYSAVTLVDKLTGKRTDLLNAGSYDYSVQTAGTVNRFKIQLSPKISTGVSISNDYKVQIISEQGIAKISGLSGLTPVKVYDTTGKMVFNKLINNYEQIRLNNTGLYIFEIATPEKTEKIKTYIR